MANKLSRRDFLKLSGISSLGFALSACSSRITPGLTFTQTSNTPTPTVTDSPTPTQIPSSTPSPTDTPTPSATSRPPTLREIGSRLKTVIGTVSDGYDDWRNPLYREAIGTHFGSMMTSGQIMPFVIEKYDPLWKSVQDARKLANEQQMILHLHPGFYPRYFPSMLNGTSKNETIEYAKDRIIKLISLVKRVDDSYEPTFLNFVNEAIWNLDGKAGWYTDENGQNPLYRVYGKKWLSQIYMMIYEQPEKAGIKIGKDLMMIYNDSHLTPPYQEHSKLVLEALSNAKQEVADGLGLSSEDIQLDIGIQLHLSLKPDQDISYIVPPTDDELSTTIKRFSEIGRSHLSEFDIKSASQEERMKIMKRIFKTGILSGNCASINLWNTFRFKVYDPSDVFDYGPNGLFDANYKPTESYWSLVEELVHVGVNTSLDKKAQIG